MRIPMITLALTGAALLTVPAVAATPAPKVTSVKSFQVFKKLPVSGSGGGAGVRLLAGVNATTSSKKITATINGAKAKGAIEAGGGYGVPTLVVYRKGSYSTGKSYSVKIKLCASSGSSCSSFSKTIKTTKGAS